MGKITKYSIDRLGERNIELRFDCPYCGSARIGIKYSKMDFLDGIVCPKCKSRIILDNLSLTVVQDIIAVNEDPRPAISEPTNIS